MIFLCGKDGIEVQTIKAEVGNIVQIFRDVTVNEIRLRENGGLSLMLINGQELGKEKPS